MAKSPWSISTTVRNPLRMRAFLKVLSLLDGQENSRDIQRKYQILLIQNKEYRPNNILEEEKNIYDNLDSSFTYEQAEIIFNRQNYVDPAMRGRNSMSPLRDFGLCFFDEENKIRISKFGKLFLEDNYDLEKVFLKPLLKWQCPNPISTSFSSRDGFNIKPFIGALHLIKKVNELCEENALNPVGLSKEEFDLFVPTLIDYRNIATYAQKIINFRIELNRLSGRIEKDNFRKCFKHEFISGFLNTTNENEINRVISNLKDYGDNTRRYFRLTKLLHIRGGGYYIDLEKRRINETNLLLQSFNASADNFENAQEYLKYLTDFNQPVLPWHTSETLVSIVDSIIQDISQQQVILNSKSVEFESFNYMDITGLSIEDVENYIESLRQYRNSLLAIISHCEAQEVDNIREYINRLADIRNSKQKQSIELEYLSTLALNVINDAIKIKPNYPLGDDNQPIFTAPAGVADIECYYNEFNAICEVTMLCDRSQWYNEGQPVMRHLREFEDSYIGQNKDTYCLFVAPKIHTDTISTYYNSVKYEYNGRPQKIIPFTISQLIEILELILEYKQSSNIFRHSYMKNLYDSIIEKARLANGFSEWLNNIPEAIDEWKNQHHQLLTA